MKNLFLGIFLLLSFKAYNQITFNKQFDGGFPFLTITNIYPTDSCYYTTAVMTDSTEGLLTIGNTFHKFDLEGNILVQKSLGSPNKFYQIWDAGLVPTDDEGLITLGVTNDSLNKGVIIKYDMDGDTLFTKEFFNPLFPAEDFIYAASIRPDNEGGFWVLMGIDGDPDGANGDTYLMHVDDEGNILSDNHFGTALTEGPFGLLIDSDGTPIIGSSRSNIQQTGNNFSFRSHVYKMDEYGEIEWEYFSPGFPLTYHVTSLLPTPDGGLIAASGKGIEYEINSNNSHLLWFPYFFKLDANHQLEWSREFRGLWQSIDFNIREMVAAQDGSGYIGVSRISENVSTGEEALGSWLMKVSPQGDSLWVRYYSFFDSLASQPTPYDIKNTPDGGYIIVGQTSTRLVPDTQPVRRGWLLKVDEHGCLIPGCQGPDTSAEEEEERKIHMAIYPNPASDFLNFELRGQKPGADAVFQIIDAQGRVLKHIPADQVWGTAVVPLERWSSGTYWLQYMEAGNVMVSEAFVVQ
jgi:hypothetical protein